MLPEKNVEEVTVQLRSNGIDAGMYHAGLSMEDRIAVQEGFMNGDFPVVVATNAFGMGVDKEDVRCIIHWEFPGTVEVFTIKKLAVRVEMEKNQKRFYYTEMWIEKYKSFHQFLLSNIRMYRKSLAGFTR